jgi:hypothetical protein
MQISHSDGNLIPSHAHETGPLTSWLIDRLELVFSDLSKCCLQLFVQMTSIVFMLTFIIEPTIECIVWYAMLLFDPVPDLVLILHCCLYSAVTSRTQRAEQWRRWMDDAAVSIPFTVLSINLHSYTCCTCYHLRVNVNFQISAFSQRCCRRFRYSGMLHR